MARRLFILAAFAAAAIFALNFTGKVVAINGAAERIPRGVRLVVRAECEERQRQVEPDSPTAANPGRANRSAPVESSN